MSAVNVIEEACGKLCDEYCKYADLFRKFEQEHPDMPLEENNVQYDALMKICDSCPMNDVL